MNERFAFNTKTTKSYFKDNRIVALKADRDRDPAVDQLLIELGNSAKAIPYYAIYQPGKPPVHFEGYFMSSESFLEKFEEELRVATGTEMATADLDR